MPTRPKTGERRRTRQPLKIDLLPDELRDTILLSRAAGKTWEEIQAESSKWEAWSKVDPAVQANFPGRKLPRTTLQRWYDLRVEQVKREMLADQARSREIAALFAGKGFKELPDAVRNALGDQVFSMMQSADSKNRLTVTKGLLALGELLNEQRKTEIREREQKTNEKALELRSEQVRAKVAALKKDVDGSGGKKQISPDELKKRVDEIYGLSPA